MKIRFLLIGAFLAILLLPTLAIALESGGPITEIEKPNYHCAVAIEIRPEVKAHQGVPIPRIPPIVKEDGSSILSIRGGPAAIDNKSISAGETSVSNGSVPMGNMATSSSQTERLLKLLEGVIRKLG